jgi:hypothetical protein
MGDSQGGNAKKTITLMLVLIVIIAVGVYGWNIISRYNRGIPESQEKKAPAESAAPPAAGPPGPGIRFKIPSPEEMRQRMQEVMAQIDLTPEQQEKVDKLDPPTNLEEMRKMRGTMQEILTPEQMQKLETIVRSRIRQRLDEAKQGLSQKDQEALERRFEKRREQFRQQGGRRSPDEEAPASSP